MKKITHVDCTLRDGGYYNNWDFTRDQIAAYLPAMAAVSVDVIELGLRSFNVQGYKGPCAFTTDQFLRKLAIPNGLTLGVMVNAAELVNHKLGAQTAVKLLFSPRSESPVELVRVACHIQEVEPVIPACTWLIEAGYRVGLNLMQIANRTDRDIENIAALVEDTGVEVLYFADSLGSLEPEGTSRIVSALRRNWSGPIGIHTHDNMGRAMINTLQAIQDGVTWVDSTVTGMGRGPGNAQTEYLVIELERLTQRQVNLTPLLGLINTYFAPLKARHGWGINPFYYLAGQYGIHPTFVQEMLVDPRYEEADILAAIEHLRQVGGTKFSERVLDEGRHVYRGEASGSWKAWEAIEGKDVLVIGSGPSAQLHRDALERYIREHRPFVIALNTQSVVDAELIDVRAACHPVRLLADCEAYKSLPQPLVAPVGHLSPLVQESLNSVTLHNFGLSVKPYTFQFNEASAIVPSPLVAAYTLAICTSGRARRILLSGFDGYEPGDVRNSEMEQLFSLYQSASGARPLLSITQTTYQIPTTSIYAL
jgi:4-hydroxy 2-oxovalerate aldolase